MLTKKQLTAIYEREMENQPSAGLDVTTANKNIRDALDDYCAALNYEAFLWAMKPEKRKKWLKNHNSQGKAKISNNKSVKRERGKPNENTPI